jgi:hypothetical protein
MIIMVRLVEGTEEGKQGRLGGASASRVTTDEMTRDEGEEVVDIMNREAEHGMKSSNEMDEGEDK